MARVFFDHGRGRLSFIPRHGCRRSLEEATEDFVNGRNEKSSVTELKMSRLFLLCITFGDKMCN